MIQNVEIETVWGYRPELTVKDGRGVVDENASYAFTHGQCHAFAIAMHDITGWPIIGIGGEPDTPSHFCVYDPHIDDFVDIDGAGVFNRDGGDHRCMVKEFTRDKAFRPRWYLEPDIETAKLFVPTVLNELDKLPEVSSKKNRKRYLGKSLRIK
jgi:hypothetical protein